MLGIALLVAVLGRPASLNQALTNFDHAWLMCAGAAALSAVISSMHRPADAAATGAAEIKRLAAVPG